VFLGTPAFAVPSLEALARLRDDGVVRIAGVITQPDRKGSRGVTREPPVKEAARALGLELLQPERLSAGELAPVLALRPDLLVWAAYGNKIPKALLDAVTDRAVNVHASLLPRWRGAAPVAHAILGGDAETGVTLMEGTPELDAGPILAQAKTRISERETRGELEDRLARLGADLLERELPRYLRGELVRRPQEKRLVTLAPKLDPSAGELDLAQPADLLMRTVRAYTPDPGAFVVFRGQRIGVLRASVAGGRGVAQGTFELRDGFPHVAAGAGWLRLEEVTPAGRRAMRGDEWARGLRGVGAGEKIPS
jgi:methionyl-tRNA formyltransferase